MSVPVLISDSTLRDGNHAVAQQLDFSDLARFVRSLDLSGVNWIEIGHGNGLSASSINFGESPNSDREIIEVARANVERGKISVHVMPGIATFQSDVTSALELGVDVVRVASHCTEADTTLSMITRVCNYGGIAAGVLMMAHRVSPSDLAIQAQSMYQAGAQAVFVMDSAGSLSPTQTRERIDALTQLGLGQVGFHAHNNRGLAIANSLEAVRCGAGIIDGTAMGFGAGAGNAPVELLLANLMQEKIETSVSLESYFGAIAVGVESFGLYAPKITPLSILTGTYGIFSGFARQIREASEIFTVSSSEICLKLSQFETVAGQEDLVFEIAEELSTND